MDKIRKAVIGGSVAPMLMFLAWNTVILGSVSKDAGLVAEAAGGVFDPLQVCRSIVHGWSSQYCRIGMPELVLQEGVCLFVGTLGPSTKGDL